MQPARASRKQRKRTDAHKVHDDLSESGLYRPVWQSLHDGAPLLLYWPGPQDVHASMDVLRG